MRGHTLSLRRHKFGRSSGITAVVRGKPPAILRLEVPPTLARTLRSPTGPGRWSYQPLPTSTRATLHDRSPAAIQHHQGDGRTSPPSSTELGTTSGLPGVSVVGMGDGAGLDPGRPTADHQLTSFAAVRAGHPGWDVVAVDAAAGGAGGRAARPAWRAGIPPSPVIPVPGRQRYATGPPPSRPGTTTSSCPCCSSSCPSFPSWPRPSPRFPTQQVNEMLTRRVNVSLTGSHCRLG
jgi:hypothetical protein